MYYWGKVRLYQQFNPSPRVFLCARADEFLPLLITQVFCGVPSGPHHRVLCFTAIHVNSFRCIIQGKNLHHSLFLHSSSSFFTLMASKQHLREDYPLTLLLKRAYKCWETNAQFRDCCLMDMRCVTCRHISQQYGCRFCRRRNSTSDIYTDNVPPAPLCRHCIPVHSTWAHSYRCLSRSYYTACREKHRG